MIVTPQTRHTHNKNLKLWADEQIWGHRFYNDQTPWLVFLEFLTVFEHRYEQGIALSEPMHDGKHEVLSYDVSKLGPLRFLVFNNPQLSVIEGEERSNRERWKRWLASVEGNQYDFDFSYLQMRFEDFSAFVRTIEFFRTTAVEAQSNRRWTSRFVFPYGKDCLYIDLDGKRGLGSPDRRFFARSGELLYLMLNRSGRGPELAKAIHSKLLDPTDKWNRLATSLLDGVETVKVDKQTGIVGGYLPFSSRDEYGKLADDWLGLLGLNLPGASLLDAIVRITGLHLLLYMLNRSNEEIGQNSDTRILLEIAAPRKTQLFELSSDNFKANRTRSSRAIEAYIRKVKTTEEWRAACAARDPNATAYELLQSSYHWKPKPKPHDDPDQLFKQLLSDANKRHNQHVGKVHSEWSRRIGLSVARRGKGTWYAPTDTLLKALVIATVDEREEYREFLSRLYTKYRIVIGIAEAERAFGKLPTDETAFAENAKRLEQRLRTLGVLQRLSDDCAYVINPFSRSAR